MSNSRIAIALAALVAASPLAAQTRYYMREPVQTPIPQAAAPAEPAWTTCAQENGFCRPPGAIGQSRTIRYGVEGSWTYEVATRTCGDAGATFDVACNNPTFGDPAFGVLKHCDYGPIVSSGPSASCPAR